MKKILLFYCIFQFIFTTAQIEIKQTISALEEVKPIENFEVRISEYKKAGEFLGLVGKRIFVFPLNNNYQYYDFPFYVQTLKKFKVKYGNYKPGEYRDINIEDYNKYLAGKYLTIEKLVFGGDHEITPEEWDRDNLNTLLLSNITMFLIDKENGVKFKFKINRKKNLGYVISEPYFTFLKSSIINQNFLDNENGRFSVSTSSNIFIVEPKNYTEKNVFVGKNIVFEQSDSDYVPHPTIYVVLTDHEGKEAQFPLEGGGYNRTFHQKFINKKVYDQYYAEQKKIFDKHKKEEQDLIIASKEQKAAALEGVKRALLKKYGPKLGNDIIKGIVRIGMTSEMVLDALGGPDHINVTETAYSYSEQWVYESEYSGNSYYYFQNGKLTAMQY